MEESEMTTVEAKEGLPVPVDEPTAGPVKPKRSKKKAKAKGDTDDGFDETADAALEAAHGDPVEALQALAEAICRRSQSGKMGAGAVLYRTLQAQLLRKGGGVSSRMLESRESDDLDASLSLTMTTRAPKSPGARGRTSTGESVKPRPSPYEVTQALPRRLRNGSPAKSHRGHRDANGHNSGTKAASRQPEVAPDPVVASEAPSEAQPAAAAAESTPERPSTVPAETAEEASTAPTSELVPPATAPAGEAATKARTGHRVKSPNKAKSTKAKGQSGQPSAPSAEASRQSSPGKPARRKAASRKGSPSKGLDFLQPPTSPGRSALDSYQSRASIRSRAMSAPVRERAAGHGDRHERLGSTTQRSLAGSTLGGKQRSRARTVADDSELGLDTRRGTAPGGPDALRSTSVVDVRSWLRERQRKDARRERMLQGRVRRDERFLEMLDEKQAERNKLLQENEDRMAQNVAVAKAQKWKPVPFTPWPNEGKDKHDIMEDSAFTTDVERLFGDVCQENPLSADHQLLHTKPHWVTLGLGLIDEGRRAIAQRAIHPQTSNVSNGT